jgi:hypothetical protein
MRVKTVQLWTATGPTGFEVLGATVGSARTAEGKLLPLGDVRVACVHGTGVTRKIGDCAHCRYAASVCPGPGPNDVTLRCLTTDTDEVAGHTRPVPPDWVLPEGTSIGDARAHARAAQAPCALLARGEWLVDLVETAGAEHTSRPLAAVLARSPLGSAVDAMRELDRSVLLVIDQEGAVLGVISREMLVAQGVPAEMLAP